MIREMLERSRVPTGGKWKRHNYRYRRFQALSDALDIYFVLSDVSGTWLDINDICDELEWDDRDPAIRKRVRRIFYALQRIERIEIKKRSKGQFSFVMARVPKIKTIKETYGTRNRIAHLDAEQKRNMA
jgi:hypothetical protein